MDSADLAAARERVRPHVQPTPARRWPLERSTHNLPEPAGSLALAALLAERDQVAGKKVAIVHTGGNCDYDVLARALSASGPTVVA